MKLWLSVFVLSMAMFARIETKSYDEAPSDHHIHVRAIDELFMVPASYPTDVFKPVDIALEGEYHWELIYYIDNRGQKNPYKETRKVTTTLKSSYSDLSKSVMDQSTKMSTSLEVGGVFEVITASVKGSIDATLASSYQSTIEKKTENVVTKELTREFTVGADSIGEMYRLVYRGPGVLYETDIISSDGKRPYDKVIINCQVRQVPLIKGIKVVHTEQNIDMPRDVITETFGGSPDVNKGFGGKYVWLVPEWTKSKDDAATTIQIVMQREQSDGHVDLAAGSGGVYRYLKMLHDPSTHTRIKRVGLLRSPKSKYIYGDRHQHGWDECTGDINSDRKGDWLHLCWNTVSV